MNTQKVIRVRTLGEKYYNQPCTIIKRRPGMMSRVDVQLRDGTILENVLRTYLRDPEPEENTHNAPQNL